MPAFDLVINTAASLEPEFDGYRALRAGRQMFWPGAQGALWRAAGLVDVSEIPVVVDCEYPSQTTGPPSIAVRGATAAKLWTLTESAREAIKQHVRSGYLLGAPDGLRSFPMMFRTVKGIVPK